MKVVLHNVSRKFILAGGITLAATAANAQMKIGDNPSQITRSAILELNSTRQGLLLPRLTDTVAINTTIGTDVVDGMLIFLNSTVADTKGIYMRKDGHWVKIASAGDAASNWGLTGNAGTDATTNFIGTADAQALSIRANSVEAISVQTTGAVQLKQVAATTTDAALEVLVIEANGTIVKKQVPAYAFKNLLANSDTTNTSFNISQATDGQMTINAPVMTGNPDRKYGFMTFEDWTRLNDLATGNSLTVANLISGVAAADATKAAQIAYNTTTSKYELALIEADATHNGVVTTGAQTFAGGKTFNGAVTVNGATNLNNTLSVGGNTTLGMRLDVAGQTQLNNTLDVTGATALHNGATVTNGNVEVTTGNLVVTAGTTNLGGTVTLNTAAANTESDSINVLVQNATSKNVEVKSFSFDAIEKAITLIKAGAGETEGGTVEFIAGGAGTDFNIVADGTAKTVTFNLPAASAVDSLNTTAKRGVVTTGYQSFDGNKSFVDSISVGKPGLANSTLEVNGSVAMAIRTVTATTTINEKDNTVLVNAAAAVAINLPAAATIPGRIYTIKKIGGGLDNAVTITPASGTIEGGTNYVIYNDWTFVTIQTDGTNWYIIKK